MKVEDVEVPEDLHYTREHEWLRVKKDGTVLVGVTDYAQKMLHEIVFVELPKVSARSEVYSPVSGLVMDVNRELMDKPELVNREPYGKGWIALMKPDDLEEDLAKLVDPTEYAKYVEELLKEKA